MYCEEYQCWRCGKPVKLHHEPQERVFCEECRTKEIQDHKKLISEYALLKTKVMFDNALRIMEKSQRVYMYEYKDAADEVLEAMQLHTDAFYSADEVVTAIILAEYGIEFIPNYSVGSYRVDFYLPKEKLCVEIDGHLHRFNAEFDSKRDIDIRHILGAEWEIIRIPTKYVEKDPTKIPEAIEEMAKQKRKIRAENGGFIPETFSARERKYYDKIGEHRVIRRRNN